VYLTELRHSAINLRRQIAKKMRIFTDFCYHSHRFFSIATGLQLICEFAAQNSQTSRNIIANSQSIRKLFSRRSCDIRKNVVRMSYDVLANVAWLSQTSRSNTLRMNCEFSRVIYIYRASSRSHIILSICQRTCRICKKNSRSWSIMALDLMKTRLTY